MFKKFFVKYSLIAVFSGGLINYSYANEKLYYEISEQKQITWDKKLYRYRKFIYGFLGLAVLGIFYFFNKRSTNKAVVSDANLPKSKKLPIPIIQVPAVDNSGDFVFLKNSDFTDQDRSSGLKVSYKDYPTIDDSDEEQ